MATIVREMDDLASVVRSIVSQELEGMKLGEERENGAGFLYICRMTYGGDIINADGWVPSP